MKISLYLHLDYLFLFYDFLIIESMKKYFLFLVAFVFGSCGGRVEEQGKIDGVTDSEVTVVENFNNSGVNFRIESTGLTRVSGIIDEYDMESSMPDGIVLKGLIRVERLPSGYRAVSLYRTDEDMLDEKFIGAYAVDRKMIVRAVSVGDNTGSPLTDFTYETLDIDLGKYIERTKQLRLPRETYWACVRREYAEMKEAYENRPLDDIACDIIAPACKVLAMVAAAYECGK